MTQSVCINCVGKESLIHAFLECKNMTDQWRSIELWLRDNLNQHVKISEIVKTSGINNDDYTSQNDHLSGKRGYI